MAISYQRHVPVVSEENPELQEGQKANPCDGEEANPFDADRNSEAKTTKNEPEPPSGLEGLLGALLVLVCEGGECEGGKGGGGNERRIEENQASLSKETVLFVVSVTQAVRGDGKSYQR